MGGFMSVCQRVYGYYKIYDTLTLHKAQVRSAIKALYNKLMLTVEPWAASLKTRQWNAFAASIWGRVHRQEAKARFRAVRAGTPPVSCLSSTVSIHRVFWFCLQSNKYCQLSNWHYWRSPLQSSMRKSKTPTSGSCKTCQKQFGSVHGPRYMDWCIPIHRDPKKATGYKWILLSSQHWTLPGHP